MSKVYLKVKIKSLAAEARIIRQEEKRWPGPSDTRQGLHQHRVGIVRSEARAALLAYGFIRGRRYSQIEGAALTNRAIDQSNPDFTRVATLVKKYGNEPAVDRDRILAWTEEKAAA